MIYDAAEQLLRNQISVIFDGIHLQRRNRDELRDFALRNHAKQSLIFVTASPDVITSRLKQRLENPAQTRQSAKFVITQEHFERVASYLEEPVGEADVLVIDTSEGVDHKRLDQLCSLLQEKIDYDGTETTV